MQYKWNKYIYYGKYAKNAFYIKYAIINRWFLLYNYIIDWYQLPRKTSIKISAIIVSETNGADEIWFFWCYYTHHQTVMAGKAPT